MRGLASVEVGARVRFTGSYLASTGQQTGPEGLSVWTVQACQCGLCAGGGFACTNEALEPRQVAEVWGDLPEAERPKWRHINLANLMRVGGKPKASDYP